MLRKIALAGALIALLVGPAAAQMPMPGMKMNNAPKTLTPEERAKQKAIDDAYQAANKKIPEKKVAEDPWGGIRQLPPTANSRQ